MPTRSVILPSILALVLLAACASEDASILNPPPNSLGVRLRFMNLVPDASPRRLLLERGFQSAEVMPGAFSATIGAPADSSTVEILVGSTTEFRSDRRYIFTRNTIANIVAVGGSVTDTVVQQTIILPLTGAPVSSVRIANMVPDTALSYDVRFGCPSGHPLSASPIQYRRSSLYADVVPGKSVFSIVERTATTERTLGLVECDLAPYRPYALYIYKQRGIDDPQLLLLDETDTTTGAARLLVPVSERVGEVRVVNMSTSTATVRFEASGTSLASNIASQAVSAYATVPTCVSMQADRFVVDLQDGRSTTDSTIFSVRRRTTVIAVDSGNSVRTIIAPPVEGAIRSGMARVRVVHASGPTTALVMSVGGRSDANASNGISAGVTLARDLTFGAVSQAVEITPGEVPLTITSASTPTSMLHVTRTQLEADKEYLFIVGHDGAAVRTYIVGIDDEDRMLTPSESAVFLRFVNGVPRSTPTTVDIASVVNGGAVFYRNSVATSVAAGGSVVRSNGVQVTTPTAVGERSLVVLSEGGGTPNLIALSTPPLTILRGQSERRVLNATKDVPFVSVAYDSLPAQTPSAPLMARRVAYGTVSATERVTIERRGTFFVFDDDAKTELYKLPMNFAPLGNSSTLIVVGSKDEGYDVIVLQEF